MAGTLRPSTEDLLAIPGLAGFPGLVHGFSTSSLGSMRGEGEVALTPPRKAFAAALGLPKPRVFAVLFRARRKMERLLGLPPQTRPYHADRTPEQ